MNKIKRYKLNKFYVSVILKNIFMDNVVAMVANVVT